MAKNKTGIEVIHYCGCGQAVRLRKRDNTWVHYGWHRQFESYADFLARTKHPVHDITSQEWKSSLTVME